MNIAEIDKILLGDGAAYEMATESRGDWDARVFVRGPKTLRDLFQETRSAQTLFVYEDERYSYDDIYNQAASVAHWLMAEQNIAKGDRVAIAMRNYPEWIAAFTAITSIGAIAVAVNAHWETAELEFALNHSGSKVVFADQERADRILTCDLQKPVSIVGVRVSGHVAEATIPYDHLVKVEAAMPDVAILPGDDATILYTSGSTGMPKGAVSTHQNIISALLSWEYEMHVWAMQNLPPATEKRERDQGTAKKQQNAVLLGIPLFHVNGLHAVLLLSYRQQRKVVGMYKWDPARAVDLIQKEQVASFVAPATMTGDLVNYARLHGQDMPSLNVVGGGGAARPKNQVKEISKTFSKAIPNTGWGMTETNAIGTGIAGMNYIDRPTSSGCPHLVVDLAVVDADGNDLPPHERGELLVRGTSVISGYWNNDAANQESFTDGWFRTGDIAYLDNEGYLYIVDRLKQLIIRGGENVGCGEVEEALLTYQGVIEAAVYGVPDDRLGEEVAATIYCDQKVDQNMLRSCLEDALAKFKVPRYIHIEEMPLPRLASGKLDKVSLQSSHTAALQQGN